MPCFFLQCLSIGTVGNVRPLVLVLQILDSETAKQLENKTPSSSSDELGGNLLFPNGSPLYTSHFAQEQSTVLLGAYSGWVLLNVGGRKAAHLWLSVSKLTA